MKSTNPPMKHPSKAPAPGKPVALLALITSLIDARSELDNGHTMEAGECIDAAQDAAAILSDSHTALVGALTDCAESYSNEACMAFRFRSANRAQVERAKGVYKRLYALAAKHDKGTDRDYIRTCG